MIRTAITQILIDDIPLKNGRMTRFSAKKTGRWTAKQNPGAPPRPGLLPIDTPWRSVLYALNTLGIAYVHHVDEMGVGGEWCHAGYATMLSQLQHGPNLIAHLLALKADSALLDACGTCALMGDTKAAVELARSAITPAIRKRGDRRWAKIKARKGG